MEESKAERGPTYRLNSAFEKGRHGDVVLKPRTKTRTYLFESPTYCYYYYYYNSKYWVVMILVVPIWFAGSCRSSGTQQEVQERETRGREGSTTRKTRLQTRQRI